MKRIFRNIIFLLAGWSSCFILPEAKAGVEPVLINSMTAGSIRVDSFRIIEDLQYATSNLSAYNLYRVENYVTLEINQDQIASCYLDTFSFWANVEITGWDESGTPTFDTGYFQVTYDQRTGKQYKGIHTKKLSGFYKLKFKVLSVSNTSLTDYIRIRGEIGIERYKTLDTSDRADLTSNSYSSTTGDITVNWAAVTGAEEYDLEYTFVDNYDGEGGTVSIWTLPTDFDNNATRVTVKGTSYSFSNVFEQGYVVFRVRPASYTGANFTYRIVGKWTNDGYDKELNEYNTHERIAVTALEPTFNWQYVNTFSEWGKRKELISYMDGTFRSRQSITRVSSDTTVIVGESVYDYQGRPALQVLPVPLDDTRIKYYPDFNMDSLSAGNYTRIHFDTGFCDPIPNPMKTSSGANQYYSSENEFLTQSSHWLTDHNPYIPQANGMAFVRTIYTDDNSGLVSVQSGVGKEHAIGSGHETKYYYGTPFQQELDRLFGNSVGFAKHYQKQMVVDPNGQVSVSYTDLSGKVIATALAGDKPSNVNVLSSNVGVNEINVELIPYNDESMPDPYTTEVHKKINVAVPGDYRLNYILDLTSFTLGCLQECYECVYDVSITVTDECGQQLLDGDPNTSGIQQFTRQLKRIDSSHFAVSCFGTDLLYKSTIDDLLSDSMRITLGAGSYMISKTLTVNEEAANYFADRYLKDTACLLEEQDFIDHYMSIIDDFGCEVTCEECTEILEDSLGYITAKRQQYVDQGYVDNGVSAYNGNFLLQMAVAEYSRKKDICEAVCNQVVSPCEYMKVVLEVDVAPGGQYEELDGDITLHPEYCKYQFCQSNTQAYNFDLMLDSVSDGNFAIELGLLDPLKTEAGKFPQGVYDTFFYANSTYKAILQAELDAVISVPDIYSTSHDLDIWQTSIWITNYVLGADTSPFYSVYAAAMASNNAFDYNSGRCVMKDPMLWETFRALYKVARNRALDQIMASTTCSAMSIPTDKAVRFMSPDEVLDVTSDNETNMTAKFYYDCAATCDSMSNAWMQLLGDCVLNSPNKEAIRLALVAKCAAGCGPDNPMGASDGFQAVLESYSVYEAGKCDPLIISTPPLSSGYNEFNLDSNDYHCVCEGEDDPCLQMDTDPIYRNVIRTLYYNSKQVECDTICYECKDIQNALIPFFEKVGDTINVLDSTANWPIILTSFLNRELKLNHDYESYIEFMRSCANLAGTNADEDSVVRRFQGLPQPQEYISDEYYIDSIQGVIEASLMPYYNPDHRFYSSGILAQVEPVYSYVDNTGTFAQDAVPDVDATLLSCTGYIKVYACVCRSLDARIDANSNLKDPTHADWESTVFQNCDMDPALLKKILEVCQTAYMSKAGKDISEMDDAGTWTQQDIFNLEDLVDAKNLYMPAACVEDLDCITCNPNPPLDPPIYQDPPEPLVYVPYLPCDSILNFLDSFIKANIGRMMKPLGPEQMQEIADSLDSRFSGEPYKRMECEDPEEDDPDYRRERLIAEVFRCTNNYLIGGCSDGSGVAEFVRSYFSCEDNACYLRNSTSELVKKWLRKDMYLKKDSLPGSLFTSRTNLLWTDEHNLSTYSVIEYTGTDLYGGTNANGVDHYFSAPMRQTGPGPKKFWITDGTDSVLLWLAFFAPDKTVSLISQIRGVVRLDPYMAAPCDNAIRYNLEVIFETDEREIVIIPMFGKTDSYELMDTCGVTPALCGRSNKIDAYVGTPTKCLVNLDVMAESFGRRFYQAYADSVRASFIHQYKTHCIVEAITSESLTMRFDQQEYHYTLYYYDIAGNLIQTVPPQGVDFGTPSEVAFAGNFRKGIGTSFYPTHSLTTYYQYNSLNELKWQATPDGGVSDFWYDKLGRLVVSRNAKQKAYSNPTFSYTRYDDLGRIREVGEVSKSVSSDTMTFDIAYNQGSLDSWLNTGSGVQITNTYYDEPEFSVSYNGFSQNYLRNRVVSTTFTTSEGATAYQSAVHYDYDEHGNVKAMVRETPGLDSIFEQFKVIRYEYELVSRNVLKVLYQQDSLDRFFHRYEYDADNRVIGAYTSRDQIHWDRDAKYMYYLHGPMARTELGELRVQGMDYAYTLHGWLKGVNSERLRTSHDIGKDGNVGSTNQWVCKDEFGFGLGYFDGDYSRIGPVTQSTNFLIGQSGSMVQDTGRELFNGNISTMVTSISKFMEQGDVPFGRAFQYDQLNRIMASRAFNNVDTTANTWKSTGGPLTQYATNYTYDANGNILSLVRKGKSSQPNMDELSYHYYSGTNRLEYVDDAISATNYGIDIDDQAAGNYTYDAIGNLISDASEEIDEITWTVYGKIQSIIRTTTSTKPNLEFEYSPDGYRAAKHVTDPTTGFTTSTWYVRDASGNIMATYEKTEYTGLDTTNININLLNSLVENDWGAHVFATFLFEEVKLHEMMNPDQFTTLKADLFGMSELDTALRMISPLLVLLNEATLMTDVENSYSTSDFYDAMISFYGSADQYAIEGLIPGCDVSFISYLIQNYQSNNSFLENLFGLYNTEAQTLWGMHSPDPYPGDALAASWLISNAPTPQFQDDFADLIVGGGNASTFISNFTSELSLSDLETAIQVFGSLKSCTNSSIGQTQMFTILDLYDRTTLWDEMIANSSLSDLTDMMITHAPGEWVMAAIELSPSRANDLFQNLPVTYHVTDYLNAILNYPAFGTSYYNNIVNQLMTLGFVGGGWSYLAGEHHIYGSSRVGVHKTDLLMRSRYANGDISITLDDVEYTSLYRGKRYYELSNHLGNVQVVVSDKRISVCDEELEVDYFKPDVLSAMDYYPFGMMMPDRQWYAGSDSSIAVNGFNGMRKDNDVNGVGNSLDFGARIYDSRLGRWFSTDPAEMEFPAEAPYLFAGSSPLQFTDIGGLSKYKVIRIINESTGKVTTLYVLVDTETLKRVSGSVSDDASSTPGWYWYDVHEVTQITIKANGMVITEELDDELGEKRTETPSWNTSETYANWKKTETSEEEDFEEWQADGFGIYWMSSKQIRGSEETRICKGCKLQIENIDYLLDAVTGFGKTPGMDIPKKYLSDDATMEALYYLAKAMDVDGELTSKGIDVAQWIQEKRTDKPEKPMGPRTLLYTTTCNTPACRQAAGIETGTVKTYYYSDETTETEIIEDED